ncbi:MAG: exosortase system-associated protein, TIGR04073 family [Mariprofundales bacterium]
MRILQISVMTLLMLFATSAMAANPCNPCSGSKMGMNPCHGTTMGYTDGVVAKFSRGFANTATGWLELPKNVINESKSSNVAYGMTLGLLEGVMHTVGRTLVGAVELGTFFIPNPEFIHPRYVWSPFEKGTRYGTK